MCYSCALSLSVIRGMQEEEARERREAEFDFVSAAYDDTEAWVTDCAVVRRLRSDNVSFLMELQWAKLYPAQGSLDASVRLENGRGFSKAAHDAVPDLLRVCREAAEEAEEEAIFAVFARAQEWLDDTWPALLSASAADAPPPEDTTTTKEPMSPCSLTRNLIYSHHIISSVKRADIKRLASELHLTGYMKIGWPGILLLEGNDADCIEFYDAIRRWAWQYLVLRGEMKETAVSSPSSLESQRKFHAFLEVESMSVVADHCRQVGLEALFRTSMKQYDDEAIVAGTESFFGALVHVDHMNNGKAYRKWLRRTCGSHSVRLLLKECGSRPLFVVGLLARTEDAVAAVLKQWRTRKVDVCAAGTPCYERQMKVLVQGPLTGPWILDDDDALTEDSLYTTKEKLAEMLHASGGFKQWIDALKELR